MRSNINLNNIRALTFVNSKIQSNITRKLMENHDLKVNYLQNNHKTVFSYPHTVAINLN